jgi:hypothetical protein
VRIGATVFSGSARLIEGGSEGDEARKLLYDKYTPRHSGDLADWQNRALPVAVDIQRVP